MPIRCIPPDPSCHDLVDFSYVVRQLTLDGHGRSIVDLDLGIIIDGDHGFPSFRGPPRRMAARGDRRPLWTQRDGVGAALRGLPSGYEHASQRPRRPRRGYGDPL